MTQNTQYGFSQAGAANYECIVNFNAMLPMVSQFIASVPMRELRPTVGAREHHAEEIAVALNMLIVGFCLRRLLPPEDDADSQ